MFVRTRFLRRIFEIETQRAYKMLGIMLLSTHV